MQLNLSYLNTGKLHTGGAGGRGSSLSVFTSTREMYFNIEAGLGVQIRSFLNYLLMPCARASDSYPEAVARFQKLQVEFCEPFVNLSHTL